MGDTLAFPLRGRFRCKRRMRCCAITAKRSRTVKTVFSLCLRKKFATPTSSLQNQLALDLLFINCGIARNLPKGSPLANILRHPPASGSLLRMNLACTRLKYGRVPRSDKASGKCRLLRLANCSGKASKTALSVSASCLQCETPHPSVSFVLASRGRQGLMYI